MSRGRNWCFTINNYDDDMIERLKSLESQCVYMVVGKEKAPSTNTPHLQGFVQFLKPKRQNWVKLLLGGNSHLEIARCVEGSIIYCKKEGDYFEIGSRKNVKKQGKRSELELFKDDVKKGVKDYKTLREEHTEVAARYPQFMRSYILDHVAEKVIEKFDLKEWQRELKDQLDEDPDKRTITFVVDHGGNNGKTWFAHWYKLNAEDKDKIQIMIPGKKSDMAFALYEEPRVVFFDCPRSKQGEYIQYDFLEEVKTGYVFSPKYESRYKQFDSPHVVVLMHEEPDISKLPEDRFKIINLD